MPEHREYKTFCIYELWALWFDVYIHMKPKKLHKHGGSDTISQHPFSHSEMFTRRAPDYEDFMYGEDERFAISTIIFIVP